MMPHALYGDGRGFMLFDLDGRLRKTSVPTSRPLLPVFEAVSNSFHAIQETGRPDGEIIVEFRRELTLDPEIKGRIDSVIIRDNGSGFTEDNYHAFETADTTYKLALGGKGVGRFTWLVAFAEAVIVSRYNAGADRRAFRFTARSGIEDAPKFEPDLLPAAGTTVALYGFKSPWRERSPGSLELIAADIIEHFVALFVGSAPPSVVLIDGIERLELRTEFARTYDAEASRRRFAVGDDSFTVTGLRLRRREGRSHRLLYLAHQREVKTEALIAHLRAFRAHLATNAATSTSLVSCKATHSTALSKPIARHSGFLRPRRPTVLAFSVSLPGGICGAVRLAS
jgi:hypothetical protein